MKNFGRGKTGDMEINITSLIDVIFMLVIFFMIGASFEKPAITLSLPTASSGKIPDMVILTVSVDSAGRIYFDGQETSRESLSARLAAYGPELQNMTVAMECDGAAAFSSVVDLMDTIKIAGVHNVAIRHDPR
jgi:biopolymer transport protein ExbD